MARPSPSASRRGLSKGDKREQALIDTASRLLADKPLSEISVEDLALGAGISRSSFYFYFPSKEALLLALDERIGRGALEADDDHLALREAIPRSIARLFDAWNQKGSDMRAIIAGMASDPELATQWDDHTRRFAERAAQRIEAEREAGQAPPGPPAKSLAEALTMLNEQCFLAHVAGRSVAIDADQIVATLTAVWLRSIYATDADPS